MSVEQDRDARLAALAQWLSANGAEFPHVGFGVFAEGHGGKATSHIVHGEVAIRIPLRLAISVPNVRRAWPELALEGPEIGADKWALVYLFLAVNRRNTDPSFFWAPFIQAEPKVVGTPVTYEDGELEQMRGTNLYEAVHGIRSKLRALAVHVPVLRREHPRLLGDAPCEYEDLAWAYECFWSRAFAARIGGEDVACLLPLCGMLNHSPTAHVTYVTSEPSGPGADDGWFAIRCEEDVFEGEQLYANYRHRSNEKLLLNYGFAYDKNELDAFAVKLSLAREDPLFAQKTRALQFSSLAPEHYLTEDPENPIPDTLVDALRVLCMDDAEAYYYQPAPAGTHGPISDRNEVEALSTLSRLLRDHLAKQVFTDVEADQALLASGTLSPRMRGIVLYRCGQARILRHAAAVASQRALAFVSGLKRGFRYYPPRGPAGGTTALEKFNAKAMELGVFTAVRYDVEKTTGDTIMVATKNIDAGEAVMKIPSRFLISGTAIESHGGKLAGVAESIEDFEDVAALFLNEHSSDPSFSFFFEALPSTRSESMLWSDEELYLIEGTKLHALTVEMKEELAKNRSRLTRKLVKQGYLARKSQMMPLDQYLFFHTVASQRIVEGDEGEALMLLPFLPRHSPFDKLSRVFDADGNLLLVAQRPIRVGEEVYDSVGPTQTCDHVLFYGFAMESNPCECMPIDIECKLVEEDDLQALRDEVSKALAVDSGCHFLRPDGTVCDKLLFAVQLPLLKDKQRLEECLRSYSVRCDDQKARDSVGQVLDAMEKGLKKGVTGLAGCYVEKLRQILLCSMSQLKNTSE
eukprot:m51a1_g3557 putative histone-lysine n-methyltransferase setd3 (805) ;mRNA; r:1037512-1040321